MAKQNINVGTAANDKKGDSLRAAFQKVNSNFTELYAALGLTDVTLNLGAFTFTGSTMSTDDSTNIVIDKPITVNGEIVVDGDITPKTNFGASLGTPTRQFKSLYVSTNTVFLGGVPLSLEDGTNELTINNVPISQTINYADIPNAPRDLSDLTDNGGSLGGGSTLVNGANTVSLGSDGSLTIPGELINSDGFILNAGGRGSLAIGKFIEVPGVDEHFHIAFPDSNVEVPYQDLYLGNDFNYVKIRGSHNEQTMGVDIGVEGQRWEFSPNGVITLPNGSTIGDGDAVFGVPITTTRGTIFIGNQAECLGGENHFHIMKAGQQAIDLFLGDDNNYVKLPSTGGVEISSSEIGAQYYWQFGTDGALTIPGDIRSEGNINIDINLSDSTLRRWQFGEDGLLTFPDGTVQTTAWTGTFSTLSVTGAVTAERFNTDQITVVGNRISTTVTNANLELECNGSGGVVINAIADATTASTVKSAGYLGLPQSATTTSGTLAIGDAGKHIYVTTTGQAIAIPDNSSVAYPIGTTLTFIAGPSATTVLIVINTDTLRLAGSSSTGTRTLAANGMATAVKVASTLWYINGTGLT